MFSDKKVLERLKELDVLLVKADKTKPSKQEAINADMARYGRNTIPTNIIGPANPDAPSIILPEIIGPKDALKALEQAAQLSK